MRTVEDMTKLLDRYLVDWLELSAASITKDMVRERHAAVTTNHGKYAANHALEALRTCFNFTIVKTSIELPGNPYDALTFHRERPRKDELQLFSGLRPGTLVALERA